MKYVVIKRLSQDEVETAILNNNRDQLAHAVLSAALHSANPNWAQDVCLRLARHELFNIRANAIQGFGHIARIHGELNQQRVKDVIEAAFYDESQIVRGEADDAADAVEHFLKWKIDRSAEYK